MIPMIANTIMSLSINCLKESPGLWKYAGGLEEWEFAGLALEGDAVENKIEIDDNFMT